MLLHAALPPQFWPDALQTATHLVNRRPCTPRNNATPFSLLFGAEPDYSHLRVFGCLCYPNTTATTPHKLAPRSVPCIFLGYPDNTKGYKCYNPATRRVLTSRHVVFDEMSFPFRQVMPPSASAPAASPAPQVELVPVPLPRRATTPLATTSSPPSGAPHAAPPASPVPGTDVPLLAPSSGAEASPTPHSPRVSSSSPTTTGVPSSPPAAPEPTMPPPSPRRGGHPMRTRAKDGIRQPNPRYANIATCSTVPTSVHAALRDPAWLAAMQAEFRALQDNGTWTLVPRPPRANIISGKWIFKNKYHADGSLERHKARWVVRGFTQRPGLDFDQTFSPVVKPATIRTVLHLAASRNWPLHQLDVKNAFLHGELTERVYCQQPAGFVDEQHPDHVCLLRKSLYGLKQAPRAWFQRFATHLVHLGFVQSKSDSSLFMYRSGHDIAHLLLYVDDIVLSACTDGLLRRIIELLRREFAMKDLGPLHFFLGIQVRRTERGFFLSQEQYALDVLERAGMTNCKPAATPVDTKPKTSATAGTPASDPSFYRSIVGALQYLTLTRPDIAYAVQQACLHMHAPRDAHWALVKRILRYVRGTMAKCLQLRRSSSTALIAYTDADWAGCPDTRRSTSGFCVFLGDSLVSWSSKRQAVVSRSSAEAEYRGVANVAAECSWLRHLLGELHVSIDKATLVYCDNVSAVYLTANPVHHGRTKHVELDVHFVRDKVALGELRVAHVPTRHQLADVMTKGLPTALFEDFRSSLCIGDDDARTAGGCQRG
uniref:Uncharacterized protein n=1 Tax=Arundo donax TaxID=35708 RepID=A0A0A9BDA3_ARUDO